MKSLKNPYVGVGIGAGASALTQVALRMGVVKPDAGSKVKTFVAMNPGIVGMVIGSAGAGVLYAMKHKDAALGALIGATAASVPGIILDWQAKRQLAALAAPAGSDMGLVVADQRGMGAPVIELFGEPALSVEMSGSAQSGHGSFNPAAFGGGAY